MAGRKPTKPGGMRRRQRPAVAWGVKCDKRARKSARGRLLSSCLSGRRRYMPFAAIDISLNVVTAVAGAENGRGLRCGVCCLISCVVVLMARSPQCCMRRAAAPPALERNIEGGYNSKRKCRFEKRSVASRFFIERKYSVMAKVACHRPRK